MEILPPKEWVTLLYAQEKSKLFLEFEDRFNIHDSLILCRFYRDIYWDWNYLSTIIEMTTGLKLDENALRKISSTIQNETRKFNLREGLKPEEDTLPKRFFDEPRAKRAKQFYGKTSAECFRITMP